MAERRGRAVTRLNLWPSSHLLLFEIEAGSHLATFRSSNTALSSRSSIWSGVRPARGPAPGRLVEAAGALHRGLPRSGGVPHPNSTPRRLPRPPPGGLAGRHPAGTHVLPAVEQDQLDGLPDACMRTSSQDRLVVQLLISAPEIVSDTSVVPQCTCVK